MRFLRPIVIICLQALSARASDVLTYHNDVGRTGQNLNETILTPANVNSATFGRLATISVDGKVDAQPLYASGVTVPGQGPHNLLIVATEHASMYAFDADSGVQMWHTSLLKPGETTSGDRSCGQVTPEIGVTSTPVIDRNAGPNGTIYTVNMSLDSSSNYYQRVHALDLASGAEVFNGPVDVLATYPGTGEGSSGGTVTFDPKQYKERPGLLLLNGVVYTAWSSHCDASPYTAWIIGYTQYTLKQTSILNLTPNGHKASIWQAGGGMAADASGNLYFLLANGTFDTTLTPGGFPSQGDYGNAFMKISTDGNPAPADYFNTFNTVSQSNADTDLGSGGAIVLPDLLDPASNVVHLAVGAGKDQNIYVVSRDNMGKFNTTSNQVYQQISSAIGAVFSVPAFFNNTLYYGSVNDNLKAFRFSNGYFASTYTTKTGTSFGYPGTTPSISANGTANAIAWAAENASPAVLHAYDATNLATELYNSNQASGSRDHFGSGNKYVTPTIANGKVYVGTTNSVGVFGLLPGTVTPAITSPASASAVMGKPFSYQITATNAPTSFGSGQLPAGLALNTASGVIAGIPTSVGSGSVSLSAANTGGTGNGSVSLAVTDPCVPVLTPVNRQFVATGASSTASITIDTGCAWTAATDSPSWLILSGNTGTGSGSFGFSASSNAGQARIAKITVGTQSFKLTQGGSLAIFNDVPTTDPNFDYISLMHSEGITAGCSVSPPLYCPDTSVTRAQMAVFVVAALNLAVGTPVLNTPSPHFQDMPSSSVYFRFVQRIADLGITAGCSVTPPLYCPDSTITAGQMAVFMVTAWMQVNNLTTFTYTTTPYYSDVVSSDPFFKFIQKSRDLGFSSGCTPTTFCEGNAVTRSGMSPMVMRLLGAP